MTTQLNRSLRGLAFVLCLIACTTAAPFDLHAQEAREAVAIPVPGTRISLVPPAGFAVNDRFPRFGNETTFGLIEVLEVWTHEYPEISNLLKVGADADGILLTERREVMLNGYSGFVVRGTQDINAQTLWDLWALVFVTEDFTGAVKVMSPKSAQLSDDAVRATLGSVEILSNEDFNPRDDLNFRFRETGEFEVYSVSNGNRVTLKSTRDEDAVFKITELPDVCRPKTRSSTLFSKSELHHISFVSVSDIQEAIEINVDGLLGVEYLADGVHKTSKQELVVYHATLVDECHYYRLIGHAPRDKSSKYVKEFRRLTESFARKQ